MEENRRPSPAHVADAFVKQYYAMLEKSPENLHKFYQEKSLLGWPGVDGVVTPVTTLSGINEKIMSSDYKCCSVEVKTIDAQESLVGAIIVTVTGCFTGTDNVKKNYSQTFFLAKQKTGFLRMKFYVLNDILRFFDVCESKTAAVGSSEAENDQPAPTQISAPSVTCDVSTSLNFKAAIENGKVKEATDLSLSAKKLANGSAASTRSIPSGEKKSVSPAKDAKSQSVDAPNANEKAPSSVKPATDVEIPSVVSPALNVEIPSVDSPALNVAPKITYASVLAKKAPVVSPKAAAVTSNISKQAVASRPSSSHRGDGTPRGGVSKAPTSSTTGGKAIYIGNLPDEIRRQGVINVVKQFGTVCRYNESVQIRKRTDGFCYGFVEFESADSAMRAVQAHHVMFGDQQAYITHKKPLPNNRGNNGGARSSTRRGNAGVMENGDRSRYGQRSRQASRDRK